MRIGIGRTGQFRSHIENRVEPDPGVSFIR